MKVTPHFPRSGTSSGKIIWRYLDLSKFITMLRTESLYFSRADKLGDPFEGLIHCSTHEEFNQYVDNQHHSDLRPLHKPNKLINNTFINCWHKNENESQAMWKMYLKSDEGIAIKSYLWDLEDAFIDTSDISVEIKDIDYTNISKRGIIQRETDNGDKIRFYFKDKSLEHEKEVRFITFLSDEELKNNDISKVYYDEEVIGINVKVDLNKLIDRIYLAPTTPSWLKESISDLLLRYNLKKDVIDSYLNFENFKKQINTQNDLFTLPYIPESKVNE